MYSRLSLLTLRDVPVGCIDTLYTTSTATATSTNAFVLYVQLRLPTPLLYATYPITTRNNNLNALALFTLLPAITLAHNIKYGSSYTCCLPFPFLFFLFLNLIHFTITLVVTCLCYHDTSRRHTRDLRI